MTLKHEPITDTSGMIEISDEIEMKSDLAGLGWSQESIWHQGSQIGMWGYFGVELYDDNYEFTLEDIENNQTKVRVFQKVRIEPQLPL